MVAGNHERKGRYPEAEGKRQQQLRPVRQCPKQGISILCGDREYVWDFLRWYLYKYAEQIGINGMRTS